jgi:hypothetical protein
MTNPYARTWDFEEDAKPLPPIPTPTLTKTACTGAEPWFPSSARSLLKKASAARFWSAATRAIGPRIGSAGTVLEAECATLCVALAKGAHRLVWEWRWSVRGQKWVLESVQDHATGELLNDKVGRERIK